MKTKLFVLLAGLMLFASICLAIAAKPEASDNSVENSASNQDAKNQTYGQCVSENTKIKNDCYSLVKGEYGLCKDNATLAKECKNTYKKDMGQCKADFKVAKKECKKIKHNFSETIRYAFA